MLGGNNAGEREEREDCLVGELRGGGMSGFWSRQMDEKMDLEIDEEIG